MTITEYFARMCAAGIDPKGNNIKAKLASMNPRVDNKYNWYMLLDSDNCIIFDLRSDLGRHDIEITEKEIQLRKDGVNLYELEWNKSTEQDVGKKV